MCVSSFVENVEMKPVVFICVDYILPILQVVISLLISFAARYIVVRSLFIGPSFLFRSLSQKINNNIDLRVIDFYIVLLIICVRVYKTLPRYQVKVALGFFDEQHKN